MTTEVPPLKARREAPAISWCLTVFHDARPPFEPWMKYLEAQQEEAPTTGRRHWQVYIELNEKKRGAFFDTHPYYAKAHREKTRGTQAQASAYCAKENTAVPGTHFTAGTKQEAGVTNGYQAMVLALKADPLKFDKTEHYGEYLKHKRAVDEEIRDAKRLKVDDIECDIPFNGPFHPWQVTLLHQINGAVDKRKVIWVVDQLGGKGKTQFSKWLRKHRQALVIDTTRADRVVFAMQNNPPVVIFDIKRQEGKEGALNYRSIETVKDGVGFQSMYTPDTIQWRSPHLLVFSNFGPDIEQLSHDRWAIYDITPELTLDPRQ